MRPLRCRCRASADLELAGCGGVFPAGLGTVQVCTAVMHYGYRIVDDMIDGLSHWMDEKGFATIDDFAVSACRR